MGSPPAPGWPCVLNVRFPGGWRLHSPAAVREAFAHAAGARLIVLRGFWRSVTNDEIADEASTLPHGDRGPSPNPRPRHAHAQAPTRTHTHTHTHGHMHMHVRMHVHVCMCVRMHM